MRPPPLIADRDADDVAAASRGRQLWLSWTRARLELETVVWSRWDGAAWSEPRSLGAGTAFRSAIALLGDGAAIAACARDHVVGAIVSAGGTERAFELAARGAVHSVALAGDADSPRAWIAWEERRGPDARLRLGRLDASGTFAELGVDAPADRFRRSPALAAGGAGPWLAWIEGPLRGPGRVFAARLTDAGLGDVVAIEGEAAPHESPALATTDDGCVLAWHGPARGHRDADVTRWLRVAAIEGATAFVRPMHPDPPVLEHDDAGFDQGWEFPAVAVDGDAVWLAGRSSHGFHAAVRRDNAWSNNISLSNDDWGGRGRRLALARHDGAVCIARREPDGIAVTALAAPDTRPPRKRATLPPPLSDAANLEAQPAGILFGDLHQHTALSDGCGTPEELYVAARDIRRLDFAAVTDHDRFCRRAIGPATWQSMCDVADAFYEPGQFATFRAYEFTGARLPGPGHKCVYFGDSAPDRVPDKDVDALFAALREHGGIAVPHHVAWTGTGADHHDPELQPVWEIISVHGCYECCNAKTEFPPRDDVVLPGQFICDALADGLRFGFIGSTDSHGLLWHHGVGKKRNPFDQGVAAVVGAERDRASILAALRARRCYATTGARIGLRLDLDGAPIGAELPAGAGGRLRVEVAGTAPLARVELVTSSGEQPVDGIDGVHCDATVAVAPRADRPTDYLYVRAVQQDGETAWSSPYWFGA